MKEGAMVFSSYIQYLGLTLILSVNPTDQWNQWRGPSGNSQSNSSNLPIKWNESQNIAWKCELPGEGASTPCIWDDSVFVTSQDGDKLLAARIELKTGKINWQKQFSSGEVTRDALKGKPGDQRRRQKFHKLHNLASPSPTTNGTSLVFLTETENFSAPILTAIFDGKKIFKRNMAPSPSGGGMQIALLFLMIWLFAR